MKRQYEAFAHAAMLSAGLFSQSPGEYHIVSQVKEALGYAVRAGWAGGVMQEWVSTALHISKEIRNTTGQFLKDLEIEDLCLTYLQANRPDLEQRADTRAGLRGGRLNDGGEARPHGSGLRLVLPHKPPGAAGVMGREGFPLRAGRPSKQPFPNRRDRVRHVQSPPGPDEGPCPLVRPGTEGLVVDLTMPRNVDPALGESAPNVTVADLEDLKGWYDREAADLEKALTAEPGRSWKRIRACTRSWPGRFCPRGSEGQPRFAKAISAAFTVAATSAAPCAVETKPASNCDGAR